METKKANGTSTAWTRNSKGPTFSGLRERVRSSLTGAGARARHRWVAKCTDGERDAPKAEDLRRIVAEVWDTGESLWVLQRIRERPVSMDHVVAFKALIVMHRVLHQGGADTAREWGLPNAVLENLVTQWEPAGKACQQQQLQHCLQAVVEYAKVLASKSELMVERDSSRGCFDGYTVFTRSTVEPADLLQAVAVLLNFAERLMPFAMHLVAPAKDWRRHERSQYIRLYVGAIMAVLDEAWPLLCAVSLLVKDLLCLVHAQKQCDWEDVESDQRPPWLQLACHLLAAQPRFSWFHASMCDFVAHCHQLRCGGLTDGTSTIPSVPESLLDLFADLGEMARGYEVEKDAVPAESISSLSTAVGSTEGGRPSPDVSRTGNASTGSWEPSPCVLHALRTVENLQRPPFLTGCGTPPPLEGISSANSAAPSKTVSSGDSPPGCRNASTPAPCRLKWEAGGNRNRSTRIPSTSVQTPDHPAQNLGNRLKVESPRCRQREHQAPPVPQAPPAKSLPWPHQVDKFMPCFGQQCENSPREVSASSRPPERLPSPAPEPMQAIDSALREVQWPPVPSTMTTVPVACASTAPGPPAWAAAICQHSTARSGTGSVVIGTGAHPIFRTPLWQPPEVNGSDGTPRPHEPPRAVSPTSGSPAIIRAQQATSVSPTMPLNPFTLSTSQLRRAAQQMEQRRDAGTTNTPAGGSACIARQACRGPPTTVVRPATPVPTAASPAGGCSPGQSGHATVSDSSPCGVPPEISTARRNPVLRPLITDPGSSQTDFQRRRSSSVQVARGRDDPFCMGAQPSESERRAGAVRARTKSPCATYQARASPVARAAQKPPGLQRAPPWALGQHTTTGTPNHTRPHDPSLPEPSRPSRGRSPAPSALSPAELAVELGGAGSFEWEVDSAELQLEELVGSGTTAEVFRGSWHGTDVAVKKLRHSGPLPTEFARELSVLLRLRHPNLVLFMGACRQAPPMIISEFCAGGTIFTLVHQRTETSLRWSQRLKIALDVAKGMNFLHRRQVIHRDLKSLNLLLAAHVSGPADTPSVKISDFGLSRALSEQPSQACMTSGAGTYHWMAPEVLDGQFYDEKVDVYSYGVLLYELICRRIPFDGSGLEPVSIAVAVSKGRRPDLAMVPKDCPSDMRFTMECCWAQCPTGRPGFDTIHETLKLVQCS